MYEYWCSLPTAADALEGRPCLYVDETKMLRIPYRVAGVFDDPSDYGEPVVQPPEGEPETVVTWDWCDNRLSAVQFAATSRLSFMEHEPVRPDGPGMARTYNVRWRQQAGTAYGVCEALECSDATRARVYSMVVQATLRQQAAARAQKLELLAGAADGPCAAVRA